MKAYEFTIQRRVIEDGAPVKAVNPETVVRYLMKNCFKTEEMFRENCWLLLLDRGQQIVGTHHLSMGGIGFTAIDIRIACKAAIDTLASGVILAHNHPSGNPMPGNLDRDATEHLKKALRIFDIELIDSIIVTDEKYFSFDDEVVKEMPEE